MQKKTPSLNSEGEGEWQTFYWMEKSHSFLTLNTASLPTKSAEIGLSQLHLKVSTNTNKKWSPPLLKWGRKRPEF